MWRTLRPPFALTVESMSAAPTPDRNLTRIGTVGPVKAGRAVGDGDAVGVDVIKGAGEVVVEEIGVAAGVRVTVAAGVVEDVGVVRTLGEVGVTEAVEVVVMLGAVGLAENLAVDLVGVLVAPACACVLWAPAIAPRPPGTVAFKTRTVMLAETNRRAERDFARPFVVPSDRSGVLGIAPRT